MFKFTTNLLRGIGADTTSQKDVWTDRRSPRPKRFFSALQTMLKDETL
jgi:hypothetical protein